MISKKIAIFSEEINGPRIAEEAKKLGHDPYLFFATEPKKKCEFPYMKIDSFLPIDELSNKIEAFMGRPEAIISCIEQFSVNIAKYAHSMGIAPSPVEAYDILRDKSHMKAVWKEKNVSTSKWCSANSFNEIDKDMLNYPVIVKPSHGAASAGVKIVFSDDELKKQIRQILRFNISTLNSEHASKSGFLVEEYIDGEEFSVDTIWFKGKPILNGIMSKGVPQGPSFPDKLYLTDPFLPIDLKNELLEVSHKAVLSSGVSSGATHTEIRIKNNKGYVIESALRPGAGGFLYSIFEKCYGVSFYKALVLVSLPDLSDEQVKLIKAISLNECEPTSRYYWFNMSYEGFGIIKSIEGIELIQNKDYVEEVLIRKNPGDYITKECDSYSYFGWIIGEFRENATFENYFSKLEELEKQIKINYK